MNTRFHYYSSGHQLPYWQAQGLQRKHTWHCGTFCQDFIASLQLTVKDSIFPCIKVLVIIFSSPDNRKPQHLGLAVRVACFWWQYHFDQFSSSQPAVSLILHGQRGTSSIQRGPVTQGNCEPEIYTAVKWQDRFPLESLVLFTLRQKGVTFEKPWKYFTKQTKVLWVTAWK